MCLYFTTGSWFRCEVGVGRENKCIRDFLGKPEGKETFRIPRRRWKDQIKNISLKLVWQGVNWIYLAQKRDRWQAVINSVMNLGV